MRPKQVKIVEEVKPVEPTKTQAQLADEAMQRKAIMDGLDSNKAKKDVQLRTVQELELEIKKIREQMDNLVGEYNTKVRINENLGNSIRSAQANLALFENMFAEKNEKRLAELEKKIKQNAEADAELQKMISENRELKKSLQNDRNSFDNEREQNRQLVYAAKSALEQNLAMWKNREADVLDREEKIKQEKAEFEAYKESLTPEIARITSIKNENDLLIKKIELQRLEIERSRLAVTREKELAEEKRLIAFAQIEDAKLRVSNEEARLRKWEQDLKDSALELKARQADVDRILVRQNLEKEIKHHEAEIASAKEKKK